MSPAELEAEVRRLSREVDRLTAQRRREELGTLVLNRPVQHTGELLGFFAAPPQPQQPTPVTLANVIAVLRAFGLTA